MNKVIDIELKEKDFSRVKSLIYKKAGISLHDGKSVLVYSRLSRVLRQKGLLDFTKYIDWLESQPDSSPAWQEFINALTTNLTSFFREKHHFDFLDNWLQNNKGKPINVWCCAASTGQEPYSIATSV